VKERAERREVAVADRDSTQVGNNLLDAHKIGGLLRQQSLEKGRRGEDVFMRWDVILRQSMEDDDIGPVQLLDLTDPKATVVPMVGDNLDR